MPNVHRVPHRSVRIGDDLWEDARVAAECAGTDRGSIIRQFLRWFAQYPGADLPARPVDRDGR